MHKYIYIIVFLFSGIKASAQTPVWGFNLGCGTDVNGKVCKVAPNGNVLVAGKFAGTMDLDPGAGVYNITSNGLDDIYLACYTSSGTFLWGFGIGGSSYDGVRTMAIDANNNVIIAGYIQSGGIDFDPGPGTTILPYVGGTGLAYYGDGFVAKYSSTGAFQWAKDLGGSTVYDHIDAINTDVNGNVYVGGEFDDTMIVTGSITWYSGTDGQAYLIKYNPSGTFVWGHNFGLPGTTATDCIPYGLVVSNGYIYTGGVFQSTSNFDPWGTPAILTTVGYYDAFIAKYDTNGNFVFVVPVSGSGYLDQLIGLALDATDNIYITGITNSATMTFDPTSPGTSTVTSPGGGGNDDIFLAKYTSTGAYQWGTVLGGTGDDYGWSVDVSNGYLYCTGLFHNTVDMDPSASVANLVSSGGFDAFVTKYDLAGNYICGYRLGSAASDDEGFSVCHDAGGDIYVSGQFGGSGVDFDPGSGSYPLSALTSLDAYVIKYDYIGAATFAGTFTGDTICSGAAHLTVVVTSGGAGPFTITYSDGTTTYTQTGVTSGVPFVLSPSPVVTTTYTLISITNAATGICTTPSGAGFGTATVVVAPCPVCDSLALPDSVHICINDTATMHPTLTGTNTILGITWTPATGLSSTTILNPVLTAGTSGWYDLTVRSLIAVNLVVNGDFSAGSTGFTMGSGYVLEPPGSTSPGHYAITTNLNLYDASFPTTGDHTTGTGNMLLVDGSTIAGNSFWCETIPVIPNTDYVFSVWVELAAAPPPSVQVYINGSPVGTFTTAATSGIWTNYQLTWNSGGTTTASICMEDLSTVDGGNDFAVDDISFQQICVAKDSVYADVAQIDTIYKHSDTSVCANITTVTLNAPTGYSSYLWSTGSITTAINVNTAGNYWVNATGACAVLIDTFNVTFRPLPVVNLGNDTSVCNGDSVILSSVQPVGSLYLWSNGKTIDSMHALTSGTYWLQVTDSGCVARDSILVTVNPSPGVNLGPDTTNCLGQSVVLQSLVTYATGVTYVWNTGATTPSITATTSGTYWLQVNNTGCPGAVDSIHVVINYDTVTLHTPDTALCQWISLQVLTTGNPANTYQWVPTTGIANSNVASPVIIADTSAEYIMTAHYPGCPDIIDSFYLDVQPTPSVYIGGNRSVCTNDTLHLESSVTPGWYTHYIYTWTPSISLDYSSLSSVVFTAGDSETIILAVTTPAGCLGIDSAKIVVYPRLFAYMDSLYDICPHDSLQLHPSGAASYSWYPSMYLDSANSAAPWVKAITSQTYTVVATSQYGCKDTLNVSIIVHPGAVIYIPDSVSIYPGETYQISPQTNCTNFLWTPPSGLNDPYISDPVASPLVNTRYYVYGTTEYGCATKDSIFVFVNTESLLDLPNAFTPGNGPNGLFKILKRGIATLNYFRIYNRWGNLVYESSDIDAGWDGTYKGQPQLFDVYVYEIEAVTNTGAIFHKHGNVTLVR